MEVDKEYLYTLKINCKGKSTVGKANRGRNVGKIILGFKKWKRNRKMKKKKRKKTQKNPAKPNIEPKVYNNNKCDF